MSHTCSIIIPTYNRKKFSKVISLNIRVQTYPFITEVLVADDGDNGERLELDIPYNGVYYTVPRCSIGAKRNFLMGQAKGNYIVCMDTDDFYNPNYISKSIFNLIMNEKQVSGSADMLMMSGRETLQNPPPVYRQRCLYLDMLNEATLVFTKAYSLTHKFSDASSNEGRGFLSNSLADIFETKIDDIMVCISHESNTVSKAIWFDDKYLSSCDMSIYAQHIAIMFGTENELMVLD